MTSYQDRVQFGSGSLQVPRIAVGCAPLGNMADTFAYGVTEQDAVDTIVRALDSPIKYIDTAGAYGDGESERRIGLALKELGGLPEGAVLETKEGRDLASNDFSGETVKRRMERSLELLGVDRVDAVFLHDPEWTTVAEGMAPGGPVEALLGFKEQGVVDYIGVAGGPNDVELAYIETGVFDAVITHNRYTLITTMADPVIDAAHARGMAVLNAAPYASGLLARGPRDYPRYVYQEAPAEVIDRALALDAIGQEFGIPLAAMALQYSLRDPRITVTIVGMSRAARIDSTLELAAIEIPDELWAAVDALPPLDLPDPETGRWKPGEGPSDFRTGKKG